MREAMAAVLAGPGAQRALQYGPSEGDPILRAELAALLAHRGVDAGAGDVLVTSGSQQALSLIATTLLRPGDRVLVESPTYLAALQAFQIAGAELVVVERDAHGPRPDALAQAIAEHQPRIVYLVPTFQNPTGHTIPVSRRRALADVLVDAPVWLVEDDPYRELRYSGEPVDAIAADPRLRDRALLLATLSKVVAPGLRIGWMTTPEPLRRALVIAKQATDLHTSGLTQAAAAHWLQRGRLEPQLGRLVAAYRERRDVAAEALADALPGGSTFAVPEGGMFLWATLPEGWNAAALLRAALAENVAFVPGDAFMPTAPDGRTLRLSFTTHTPAQLREGMTRLGRAVDRASTAR